MIIVIDGPAGAGKSTTARAVAREAGLDYVDSGAIYRGFTYLFLKHGSSREVFLNSLDDHKIRFEFHLTDARVFLEEEDITEAIRYSEVNNRVSEVSAMPEVRKVVKDILRDVCLGSDVILEGRDLGTVVFPDADIKFFLTADQKVRARRRHDELLRSGEDITLEEVLENVEKRDRIDSSREIAPLRKADDAVEIDSTNLTFKEQVVRISRYIRNRRSTEKTKR